jgi:PIN domain nuclease of toxin-antitoxin system
MTQPEHLSRKVKSLLVDPANEILLSAATGWEVAVKHKLGRLDLPAPPKTFIPDALSIHSITVLPITMAHAIRAGDLRLHHKDPFDRLLIAQSDIENVAMATPDKVFAKYRVQAIW